ncbi:MAG TPA: hypothetical protein VFB96_06875, partial [Pirellulaceae bacterium]|nr:hypothetical protein [Pirellulaceae bacterium]
MNDHGFLAAFRRTAAWLAIWLALSVVARAEMGIVQSFPAPRTKMRNSLTVEVDTRGVVSNGYRCVRVKLSNTPIRNKPAVPVTADRRFRVLLEPSGMGQLSGVATSQIIEIPEKQASAEATIAIPSSGDWFQIQLTVYEGGEKLDDVSGPIMVGFWGMRGDAETLPTLLFLDYDVPDRAARDAMVGTPGTKDPITLPNFTQVTADIQYSTMGMPVAATPGTTSVTLTDSQIVTQAASHPRVQLISPAEMSRRWIELTCYDIAFISRSDLAKMKRQNAAQRQALVDWLHGGPALVVYDAGDNFENLAEIEQLLDLRPLPDDRSKKFHGWSVTSNSNLHLAGTHTQEPVPYVGRPAGLGHVVAVASDNPFPGSSIYWSNLIDDIPTRHQHWIARHGMSYQMYNAGVWNWYIPGVGAAPVFSFLLLATFFAIVIGPVNYLFLGRIQRL